MTDKLNALDKWLNVDTWYTAHPSDDERFYKAVYAVLKANKGVYISAEEIGNYIEAHYKGKLADDFLFEESQRAAIQFETIRNFCLTNNLL
ncbi:hypothetical protein ABRV10_004743 [Citrobacter amalonaticus]|uniref:hypothetical protein n=1 Tax=Citrobacter TaxID=544 RepID=UPI000C12C089|nr:MULTISPECIES: hypothetical protein [Citrobacter]AUZ66760.1 hypothetical protein C2U53_24585 [Citrobacter sp. CFNIH10]GJK88574.1 hypothetical protein TUM17567_48690 [Citrobacter amalonaticus]HAT3922211.1 hypothetical protein [Citrobacter amalonaticus]